MAQTQVLTTDQSDSTTSLSYAYGTVGPTQTITRLTTTDYFVSDQAFSFQAYGLRPNTKHIFYFDGQNLSSACQPFGKNRGDDIITDGNGSVKFTFYYNSGITVVDSYSALQAALNNVIGNKKCELVSTEYVPGVKAYNGAYSYSSFTVKILSGL